MTQPIENCEGQSSQRSFAARIVREIVWIWAVCSAAVAVLRIVAHDAILPFYVANSLSFYLYLPSYVIVPIALWWRWWALGAICVFTMICHLVWVLPDFVGPANLPPTVGAESVKVFSANLYANNADPNGIIKEIWNADPDVLLLQEYSARWDTALNDAGIEDAYPQSIHHIRQDSFGTAIYSRISFADKDIWFSGEVPIATATIETDSGELRIVNWHPLPPTSSKYFRVLNEQYTDLVDRLRGSRTPTIVMGDFNATQHARWMKRLEALGYRSAHEEVGRGYAWTYPNGTSRFPPIRIDHALMSNGVYCRSIQEGRGAGSDHKPLSANFFLEAVND